MTRLCPQAWVGTDQDHIMAMQQQLRHGPHQCACLPMSCWSCRTDSTGSDVWHCWQLSSGVPGSY